MIRSRTLNRRLALLAAALMLAPQGALANPLGGQVVGGQATIQGQGTSTVTVTQGSQNAIINWYTFNIGAGETTQFVQPNAGAIALNRVTGGQGVSTIYGHLKANGRIFLINPDGIMIGPGGMVNAAGFLASTNDIKNSDFMAGNYKFTIPGRPDASIVNLGHITASSGGFAALVAPGVRNAGVITANLGSVALASGNGFTLDFYGDKLITLQVGDKIASQVIDVATGQPLNSLVKNEGTLKANGGQVVLTAAAARHVVDSVINTTGVIEANSVGTKNGMIVLGGATAATKGTDAPKQTVKVAGTLSASGQKTGEKGGVIQITGEDIQVTGAKLDASGQAGGGTVLVGGDTGGGTVNAAAAGVKQAQLQPWSVANASSVSIDAATVIDASAKTAGDGGKVVVWSNGLTSVAGSISATGGVNGGNGGFVETSGKTVNFAGIHVNTSAPMGTTGLWLLDPTNLTVNGDAANTISYNLARHHHQCTDFVVERQHAHAQRLRKHQSQLQSDEHRRRCDQVAGRQHRHGVRYGDVQRPLCRRL
jgi:filamentous hemagglutinin family protein